MPGLGRFVSSPPFNIIIGDNTTTWYIIEFSNKQNCTYKSFKKNFLITYRNIEFHYNGTSKEKSSNHIGIFLNLLNAKSKQFSVYFKFGVVGAKNLLQAKDFRTGQEFSDNAGYGWSQFTSHGNLFNRENNCFENGFEIYCEVSVDVLVHLFGVFIIFVVF